MHVYLESLGCRLNYAEMESLGRQLLAAGHQLVASAAEADLCVLNSCAVTGEAERQSRQLVRQVAHANPAARLVVTGCYATLEAAKVAALPNVELVVGNPAKDALPRLIGAQVEGSHPDLSTNLQPVTLNVGPARTRAFLKVQDGCRNRCTFCIVAALRGDERSRPVAEVVAEAKALHAGGYQEIVLTGVHLGGYGSDLGEVLPSLLAALLAETAVPRIRLSSLEPFDLSADLFDFWERLCRRAEDGGRLMPHLHLPAQSGSDAVLRRMARRNRVADYEALAATARARIPGLTITTDLIAGFPGETEADFAETIAFARRIGFAHIHAFPYSPRQGTAAARFPGQVVAWERKRRVRALAALDAELGRAARAAFIGQVRPVLWESLKTGAWSGLTDNYLRVRTAVLPDADLHNRIVATRLVRLEGEELWGEIITR